MGLNTLKDLLAWLILAAIGLPITIAICAIADVILKFKDKHKNKRNESENTK